MSISRHIKQINYQLDKIIGQATVELTQFKRIIGVEPGTRMIEQAAQNLKTQGLSDRIELIKSPAESIPLEDGSVDFITSGRYEALALHYLHYSQLNLYKFQYQRKLRTGLTGRRFGPRLLAYSARTVLLLYGYADD